MFNGNRNATQKPKFLPFCNARNNFHFDILSEYARKVPHALSDRSDKEKGAEQQRYADSVKIFR